MAGDHEQVPSTPAPAGLAPEPAGASAVPAMGGGWTPSVPLSAAAVLALQRSAGNRAVSRLAAASRPLLARDPPAGAAAAPPVPFQIGEVGDDPAGVIADLPAVMQSLATIQLDDAARRDRVPASILHPVIVQVYTETHIVTLLPGGGAVDVREQDVMHPTMTEFPASGVREPSTGRFWFYGHRGDNVAIQALPNILTPRVQGVEPGATVFVVYMPGITMPADLVRRLRREAGGDAGGGAWAQHAVEGAQQRVHGAGASGDGPGAGRQGTGRGGGGTGTDAGDGRPPLQGTPRLALVPDSDPPRMRITVDRATTSIGLHEGETPAALDARVTAAINALQASRDPAQHDAMAGTVTQTGFAPPPQGQTGTVGTGADAAAQAGATRGATTPSERVPGAPGGANATAYPAKIAMAGPQGDTAPTTTTGASNDFTMTLDYAALSLGFQDEVFNRLQDVQFYWELIDVTALTSQQARDRAQHTNVGQGQAEGPGSGAGNALSRDMHAIAEDQEADLRMMAEENWPWDARAAYLGVIGLSNVVRTIGSLISSFVSVVTEPLNARSIGFTGEGDYLVRCVATPQVDDAARADPDHHVIRASSTAVLPVRVQKLGTRAAQAADVESTRLQTLEAQLQEAEASHDQRRIDAARANLAAARRAASLGGFDLFTQSIDAARERVRVAELLGAHVAAALPEEQWGTPELELQIALVTRRMTIDQYLPQVRAELTALAGEGDSNLNWVRSQHDRMHAVGGQTDFRPRAALASEETGQVSNLQLMLGRQSSPGDARAHWLLVDMTSAATRDVYDGRSALPGLPGDVAAIRDCFRHFAENAGYGRGTLAIRLPAELATALGGPVAIEPAMRSAPGDRGRALQRLRDLATVAEVAGIFATGGLGVAIGAVGGVAGAIGSVDSLARRSRTGHLMEVDTVFDILGVVGGVAAVGSAATHVARDVAEAGRAAGRLPSWVTNVERAETGLHIHGTLSSLQQIIVIPYQLVTELNAVDADESLSPGQRDARRALSFLNALRAGTVTIVQATGGLGGHDEHPTRPGDEPLPPGFRSGDAAGAAEGGGERPPVHAPATPHEGPAAHDGPAPQGEPVAGPSPQDLIARAQELARLRAAAAAEANTRTAAEGEGEGEQRTTAGTAHPSAAPESGPVHDANPAERAAAVDLLGGRVGTVQPAGPVPTGPPPPPGAFGTRTRVASEAVATYDAAVAAARGREAGLFYNPNTGEFAVQVGTEAQVRAPAGDGWQALIHLHPNPENVVVHRLPAPADVMGAMRSAIRTGSHVEFVQSTRPDGTTGMTRVEVTFNPSRIVVEMPAEGNEPARRIEVATPDEYAREYGSDTTHMDPTSPLYAWVMRDLDDYYRARREDAPHGGDDGPTAAGTANTPAGGTPAGPPAAAGPTLRGQMTTGRADLTTRFAEADAAHATSGAPGPPPSAQFDAVIAHLTHLGMGAAGRTAIEDLFRPGQGQAEVSRSRFEEGLTQIQRITAMLGEQPDLATSGGLAAHMANDVLSLADEVVSRWDGGTLAGGLGISGPAQAPARDAIEAMRAARDRYRANQTGDPVERLMALLRVRDAVSQAMQVLQREQGAIAHGATTLGTASPTAGLTGVQEQPVEVTAAGRVQQSLDRDLPGGSLESYQLSPQRIAELNTNPPGLARQIADLVAGYHKAHLIGPGFGSELFEGLMLAPAQVNLELQNKGVERFIRTATNAEGTTVNVETKATGRRLTIPLADGTTETIDILVRVEYRITVEWADADPRTYNVAIDVSPPPNGHGTVSGDQLPAAASPAGHP